MTTINNIDIDGLAGQATIMYTQKKRAPGCLFRLTLFSTILYLTSFSTDASSCAMSTLCWDSICSPLAKCALADAVDEYVLSPAIAPHQRMSVAK